MKLIDALANVDQSNINKNCLSIDDLAEAVEGQSHRIRIRRSTGQELDIPICEFNIPISRKINVA